MLVLRLPCGQRGHINAALVIQRGGVVLNHHNPRADACEQAGRFAAHVTKTLQRDFGTLDFDTAAASHFATGDEYAAAGGFFTAQRTAEVNRLAGNHAGDGGAVVHGVSIHHPGHHFTVGTNVRRRNIFLRPDDNADLAGITTGQTFQFTL